MARRSASDVERTLIQALSRGETPFFEDRSRISHAEVEAIADHFERLTRKSTEFITWLNGQVQQASGGRFSVVLDTEDRRRIKGPAVYCRLLRSDGSTAMRFLASGHYPPIS